MIKRIRPPNGGFEERKRSPNVPLLNRE
jgi:hypothetical protein